MPNNYFAQNPPKQNKNEIIKRLYTTILGRDPDPSALMYYISLPEINEDAVRKQMIESEEHKKIIEDFKSIPTLMEKVEKMDEIEKQKDKAIADKQMEIEELNKILAHKSKEIVTIREELKKISESNAKPEKTMHNNISSVVKKVKFIDQIRQFIHSFHKS